MPVPRRPWGNQPKCVTREAGQEAPTVVFKRMLRAFGVGGPSVDTVLANPNVRPGEVLTGEVRIAGGDHPVDIDQVKLSLVTRVEVESGDNEHNRNVEFARVVVAQRVSVAAGQNLV